MEIASLAPEQESLPDRIPSLGTYPEVRDRFVERMTRWLPSCPRIWRLGFGVTLLRPATDRKHSYRLLATYLPDVKIDPEGSFNFLYQINRPRKSNVVPSLLINRLCKLSSFRLNMKLHYPYSVDGQKTVGTVDLSASRPELDINTDPEHTDLLDAATLPHLLNELVTLATEISERGDVP